MTLAVVNGPLHFPEIDTMKAHTSYADDRFTIRRLTATRFLLLEVVGFGGYSFRICEVASSGAVALGDLHEFTTAGAIVGLTVLADGRFVVIVSSGSVKARLHAADGTLQTEITLIASIYSGTLFGQPVFWFIGDYFDAVESEPGKVLVFVSTLDTDTEESWVTGYQLTVGSSSLSVVGSPTKIASDSNALYNSDPGVNPIGSFTWGDGVAVSAIWGNRNKRCYVYATKASAGGVVVVDELDLGTDVRLIEPILRRTASGVMLWGNNDIWGSGHTGSGTEGDAVVLVPFDGAAFGAATRTQFTDSDRFYYGMDTFDFGNWPHFQQAVGRWNRADISDGVEPEFVRYEEYLATSTTAQDNRWAPLERLDIPMPTLPPWAPVFAWEWAHYEGISATRGVILAGGLDNVAGQQRTALWVVSRGEAAVLGAQVGGTRVRWS